MVESMKTSRKLRSRASVANTANGNVLRDARFNNIYI